MEVKARFSKQEIHAIQEIHPLKTIVRQTVAILEKRAIQQHQITIVVRQTCDRIMTSLTLHYLTLVRLL